MSAFPQENKQVALQHEGVGENFEASGTSCGGYTTTKAVLGSHPRMDGSHSHARMGQICTSFHENPHNGNWRGQLVDGGEKTRRRG